MSSPRLYWVDRDSEPYLRYSEEVNWVDIVKMMHIIERYTNLLMDKPVDKTEDEFFDYVESNTRPMMIAQLHVTKMHYLYTMGRYGEAVAEGRKAAEILTYITQFKEEVGTCDSTIGTDFTHSASTDCVAYRMCRVSVVHNPAEFYFYYSLALLAECRTARRLATPQERVRELSSAWHGPEKSISIKNSERRRRASLRRRRRLARETEEDESSDGETSNQEPGLTYDEYNEHLATVAQNQATLKHWVAAAPCNFAHWHRLVEVLLHTAVFPCSDMTSCVWCVCVCVCVCLVCVCVCVCVCVWSP
jgi:hypothetical protein